MVCWAARARAVLKKVAGDTSVWLVDRSIADGCCAVKRLCGIVSGIYCGSLAGCTVGGTRGQTDPSFVSAEKLTLRPLGFNAFQVRGLTLDGATGAKHSRDRIRVHRQVESRNAWPLQ
jgi:hypothetical protein